MKLTQTLIDELTHVFYRGALSCDDSDARKVTALTEYSLEPGEVMDGILAVLKVLDPIPYGIDRVRDEDGKLWRRVIHDDDAWITAGSAQIATSRRLVNEFNVTREGKK